MLILKLFCENKICKIFEFVENWQNKKYTEDLMLVNIMWALLFSLKNKLSFIKLSFNGFLIVNTFEQFESYWYFYVKGIYVLWILCNYKNYI